MDEYVEIGYEGEPKAIGEFRKTPEKTDKKAKLIEELRRLGEWEVESAKKIGHFIREEAPKVEAYIKKEAPIVAKFIGKEALEAGGLTLEGIIFLKKEHLEEINKKEASGAVLSPYEISERESLKRKIEHYENLLKKTETKLESIKQHQEIKKAIEMEKLESVMGEFEKGE